MSKKFYITTPIYYINDIPHIGHSYTTIAADVLARYHRLKGEDVFFLAGLDENSQKTVSAAKKLCVDNLKQYIDMMAEQWKKAWKVLEISNDDFIRTSEERHKVVVNKFFNKVFKKGDIYKGAYKGYYCEGCEAFFTEKDLIDGACPVHGKDAKYISEHNYFFRLSKYKDPILKYIKENSNILPESRRNEILNFAEELKDISISRPGLTWGITLPIDQDHKFWCWFDALVNYISANEKRWPADIQLVGKEILRFHAIIWPGMLMSAGYKLPKKIFAHGWLTINGKKMSKSLGNAIDPTFLVSKYGVDSLRYFLLREIPFGQDGDFSETALTNRINNELANDLGNLVSRTTSMIESYCEGVLFKGTPEKKIQKELHLPKIKKYIENLEFHHTLDEIWHFIRAINRYINEQEPWNIAKTDKIRVKNVLYTVADSIRIVSILLSPFMPQTSEKINTQLGISLGTLKDCKFGLLEKTQVKKGEILFKKY